MQVRMLEEVDTPARIYRKGVVIDLDTELANKLIGEGKAETVQTETAVRSQLEGMETTVKVPHKRKSNQ